MLSSRAVAATNNGRPQNFRRKYICQQEEPSSGRLGIENLLPDGNKTGQ